MSADPRPEPPADVGDLFAAALERPSAERSAFLDEVCGEEASLRSELESLLRAHARATGFLETPALLAITGDAVVAVPLSRRDQRIGPYRLIEEVGIGGMGTVYLAERADGAFEQRVAVKLLRTGFSASELLRRFENERRILARLEHPHIARLLDGGADDDGTPYLVMEYVDGVPIDEYCRAHQLPLRARLELMRAVCDSVHHAHRNLVVHRDLKPSNILVDREGRAKLLDFGIAKVLAPDPTDRAADPTRTRSPALTPRYASPEQMRGEAVTTASDVYSLGVVLYELLAGESPYGEAARNDRELERAVLARDVTRPSEALRRRTVSSPRLATRRASLRLARQLAGDLDTILLQCLRKEPERRYASVERLGEDLRRHLAGLPVRARPDTLRYRTAKFVRRHATAVAAAAFVVTTLIGATIVSTSLYLRADRARAEAERQRTAAEAISSFLGEILGSIDPQVARGRDTALLRGILDQAAARVERELTAAPDVAASLHLTIGSAYRSLGLYEPSERHLRASWSHRRLALGDETPATAESALALARLLTDAGRYAEAESLAGRAVDAQRARGKVGAADLAPALSALATIHEAQAILDSAEEGHREALEIARHVFGTDSLRLAPFLQNLGVYLSANDRRAEAEPLLVEAAEILRRSPEASPVELSILLHNLATLRRREGRADEAVALYREALRRMRAVYPIDHPQIPVTLNNLAAALESASQPIEAEATYREALERQRRILGGDHRDVGTTINNLAGLLRQLRRFEEAESLYREAIRIYGQALGPDHAWVSIAWTNLAHLHEAAGNFPAALSAADQARRIGRQHWPGTHWRLQQAESLRGACLAASGRDAEAESLLRASLEQLRQSLPPADPTVLLAARRLTAFLESRGRHTEAASVRL